MAERAQELSLWKEYLPVSRYVGEVGIDAGRWFYCCFDEQKMVPAEVLSSCAEVGDKILSVHSVLYSKVVLDMIEAKFHSEAGRIVLHSFTGTPTEAR